MEQELNAGPAEPTEAPIARCPNCRAEIMGPYCPECGQQQKNLNKYFWTLTGEIFDEIFRPDSRASRTLFSVMFKPGHLTTEYFEGRRARYVPPLRLYLVISFLFFFTAPFLNDIQTGEGNQVITATNDQGEQTDWRKELGAEQAKISLPALSEEENQQLTDALQRQLDKMAAQIEEDPSVLVSEFADLFSAVMFFLLPIFAMFLKIFYIGSGIYYAEHLLLAVHNHCFLFLSLLLSALLELGETTAAAVVTAPMETALGIWIPIYIYLSMIKTYGQGHFVTIIKFSLLAMCYFMLSLIGFVFVALVGIMTL
jgi:hypothetical protein